MRIKKRVYKILEFEFKNQNISSKTTRKRQLINNQTITKTVTNKHFSKLTNIK